MGASPLQQTRMMASECSLNLNSILSQSLKDLASFPIILIVTDSVENAPGIETGKKKVVINLGYSMQSFM